MAVQAPRRDARDLLGRVVVAVPAVAFALFIVAQGGWVFAAGVMVLGLVCLHELFRMYEPLHPVKLAGFLALIGLVVAARVGGERQVLLVFVASVALVFLLSLPMPRTSAQGIAVTQLALAWVGLAVAHAVLLRDSPHGGGILLDVLVGTFVGDTGAYLGGRSFGLRPLAPSISPNKTVEGLLVGMVFAVVATWCAGLYQDWLPGWHALLLGVAVALAAPLGDLLESKVKRDAGTKDAGKLFGVHGGALDRLDAALFTIVAGYYVWLALQ